MKQIPPTQNKKYFLHYFIHMQFNVLDIRQLYIAGDFNTSALPSSCLNKFEYKNIIKQKKRMADTYDTGEKEVPSNLLNYRH